MCDSDETIVSPLKVLSRPKSFIEDTVDWINKEKADAIVIGMPFNMNGTRGPKAKAVLKFAERLRKKSQVPIYFQDERLSTFAAEQKLSDLNLKWRKKQKKIDAIAAADILESFLEQKKGK